MSLEQQHRSIRLATALSESDHVALRLVGDEAFDLLDALCPADLYVRDGQMMHTLLLDEQAHPLADVYLCRDDEDFIVLSEGPPADALIRHLREHAPRSLDVDIEDLGQSHRLLSLHGPWAWELMSSLAGPGVLGLPYLSFYHEEGWTCFRAGKTGEFGYDLLVPRERADALRDELLERGAPLDLGVVGREALEQCALENWFFNIHREGRGDVTPLELQLQWRVSYKKDYVGSAALLRRRDEGARARLTCVVSAQELAPGDSVTADGRPVGAIVNAGYSSVRGDWVALALLGREHAHAGLDHLRVGASGEHAIRTVSPPVIDNRSLFINLQKHSYRTREEHSFPPLHGRAI
ncbi:MAG: glycine cleavage T C-terminal barrel domain-containing protein [bacterium]